LTAHWRTPARGLLHRLGLLDAAYRARDAWRSMAYLGRPAQPGPDGLPLPTPDLIALVAGTPDASWFLSAGERAAGSIRSVLADHGVDIGSVRAMLDFGCGCGRVVRHWKGLPARVMIEGCDVNRRLARWCRRNLPFARFFVNRPRPPLPCAEGSFDVAYALSVFTHLPEDLQRSWRDELRRVIAPGGHLVFSVHGERYRAELSPAERARFDAGELVVRGGESVGRNACAAYHPREYVRSVLAEGFDLLEHRAEGALGNPHQDLVVLRKERR
jgi:SAM-dependent methyltransferase